MGRQSWGKRFQGDCRPQWDPSGRLAGELSPAALVLVPYLEALLYQEKLLVRKLFLLIMKGLCSWKGLPLMT